MEHVGKTEAEANAIITGLENLAKQVGAETMVSYQLSFAEGSKTSYVTFNNGTTVQLVWNGQSFDPWYENFDNNEEELKYVKDMDDQ
jgi:hypothetical protein